jgi:hypothetical protein
VENPSYHAQSEASKGEAESVSFEGVLRTGCSLFHHEFLGMNRAATGAISVSRAQQCSHFLHTTPSCAHQTKLTLGTVL